MSSSIVTATGATKCVAHPILRLVVLFRFHATCSSSDAPKSCCSCLMTQFYSSCHPSLKCQRASLIPVVLPALSDYSASIVLSGLMMGCWNIRSPSFWVSLLRFGAMKAFTLFVPSCPAIRKPLFLQWWFCRQVKLLFTAPCCSIQWWMTRWIKEVHPPLPLSIWIKANLTQTPLFTAILAGHAWVYLWVAASFRFFLGAHRGTLNLFLGCFQKWANSHWGKSSACWTCKLFFFSLSLSLWNFELRK